MTHTVIVASTNPTKIHAARDAFDRLFPDETFDIVGVNASSGVSDQPMGVEETLQGALNRLSHIESLHKDAHYWVSMEGGCADTAHGLEVFAWMVAKNRDGKIGKSRTASFYLPPTVADHVRAGVELGVTGDIVFGRTDSKKKQGMVGLLTDNVIDRTGYYSHAFILALIPLYKKEYY